MITLFPAKNKIYGFPVISCIYNNKNISKSEEETTTVYYFHSLSGSILHFVAVSEKAW
jgi:hypothetical protein